MMSRELRSSVFIELKFQKFSAAFLPCEDLRRCDARSVWRSHLVTLLHQRRTLL